MEDGRVDRVGMKGVWIMMLLLLDHNGRFIGNVESDGVGGGAAAAIGRSCSGVDGVLMVVRRGLMIKHFLGLGLFSSA